MLRTTLLTALLLGASAAQAHEVWIERDGHGPARIYLGEPAEPLPEGGDPEFAKLKAPKLLAAPHAAQTRKAGHIEVALGPGDVRAWDDAVFEPWGEAGKKQGVVYYARAGRTEARAAMPLEIAPVASGSDRFALLRDGKPVAGARITVITPDKWSKSFVTGADGTLTLSVRDKGRYLLSATQKDAGDFASPGGRLAVLHRITTTTFVVP